MSAPIRTVSPRSPAESGGWTALLSMRRLGAEREDDAPRSGFQRDWDRILYSPHFRRLAGKTQVFPLPLDDHIHSRLTHSLEVATVGRSLGTLVGQRLACALPAGIEPRDLGDCVAAACLAHDLGNPPFGHIGEDAIQEFFARHAEAPWLASFTEAQRRDLLTFEGNAVALRLAMQPAGALSPRGLDLTCATLGALVKYPCASTDALGRQSGKKSRSKHGIDTPQLAGFAEVADTLGLARDPAALAGVWRRHPLAFLTEAADDIAYQIIDLEDGLRLKHVPASEFLELLQPLCEHDPSCPPLVPGRTRDGMLELASRVRSIAINTLIHEVAEVFQREEARIHTGAFDEALVDHITSRAAVEHIKTKNLEACYTARDVLKLELTGSVAIQAVLERLVDAAISGRSVRSRHLLKLYSGALAGDDLYTRVLRLTDFVAGMTDHYVVRLYRELSGIRLPGGRD